MFYIVVNHSHFLLLMSLGTKDGHKYDLNGFFGNSGYQGEMKGHQLKTKMPYFSFFFTLTHLKLYSFLSQIKHAEL